MKIVILDLMSDIHWQLLQFDPTSVAFIGRIIAMHFDENFELKLRLSRQTLKGSRFNRTLGTTERHFTNGYKRILQSASSFLGTQYAVTELRAFKKVLKALNRKHANASNASLRAKLRPEHEDDYAYSALCPVARHEMAERTFARFLLNATEDLDEDDIRFGTIIHDYVPTLADLKTAMPKHLVRLEKLQESLRVKGIHCTVAGNFEPDLRSFDELASGTVLCRLSANLNWTIANHGGFVLSSHFVVYSNQISKFARSCRDCFPGYRRVVLKKLNGALSVSIQKIIKYGWKPNAQIEKLKEFYGIQGNQKLYKAMHGPKVNSVCNVIFDIDDVICEWANAVDQIGLSGFNIFNSNIDFFIQQNINTIKYQDWFKRTSILHDNLTNHKTQLESTLRARASRPPVRRSISQIRRLIRDFGADRRMHVACHPARKANGPP